MRQWWRGCHDDESRWYVIGQASGHFLRSCTRWTFAAELQTDPGGHSRGQTHPQNARQTSAKERYSGKATGKLSWTSEYFVNDSYTRNLRPTRPNPVDAVSPRQTVRSEKSAGVGAMSRQNAGAPLWGRQGNRQDNRELITTSDTV